MLRNALISTVTQIGLIFGVLRGRRRGRRDGVRLARDRHVRGEVDPAVRLQRDHGLHDLDRRPDRDRQPAGRHRPFVHRPAGSDDEATAGGGDWAGSQATAPRRWAWRCCSCWSWRRSSRRSWRRFPATSREFHTANRLRAPDAVNWLGTDRMGGDVSAACCSAPASRSSSPSSPSVAVADRRADRARRRLLPRLAQRPADARLRHLPGGAADRAGDRHRPDAGPVDRQRHPGAVGSPTGRSGPGWCTPRRARCRTRCSSKSAIALGASPLRVMTAARAAQHRLADHRAHLDRHGRHHPDRRGARLPRARRRRRRRPNGAA